MKNLITIIGAFLAGLFVHYSLNGHGEDAGFLGIFIALILFLSIPVTGIIYALTSHGKFQNVTLRIFLAAIFAFLGIFI